jgi:hypothetical protein
MDEDQLYLRPANPARYEERHPTGSELELIMWQIAKLRRDLVRAAVWAGLGLAAAAIVGIEMWSRYVAACSSN